MKTMLNRVLTLYRFKTNTFHLGIVILCIAATFWPVYKFRFLHGWDDQWAVLNYYTEDGFTRSNIYSILTNFYGGQYAPVNQLYYTAMYAMFGYDPMFYHIGGVIIHVTNAMLVYYFILQVAKYLLPQQELMCKQIALISTLLFAVSPFNLEPVVWASAAKVLLYALFYLLALHSYFKYILTGKAKWFYLTLILFVVSFGAKEQAVTLPLCLVLLDYISGRGISDKQLWLEKMPFFILSLLFGIVSFESQGKELLETGNFYPLSQRFVLAFYTISEYATKILLPVNVSYLYPFPFQKGEQMPLLLWIYPIAIIFAVVIFFKEILKYKWLTFGILFFIIHILLVINLMSLARYSVVADRYVYISSIGTYFAVAYLIVNGLKKRRSRALSYCGFVFYVAYFIIYSNSHSAIWTNAVKVKEQLRNTIRNRPDFEKWKLKNMDK